jgi:predicted AAA+ superfamily ATPase
MFQRKIKDELRNLAKQYPVVTVIGPRQSGKTTLVRHEFPEKPYVNLESPDTRELALTDPRGFLEKFPHGAILDEIQRAPLLLSYIQTLVDTSQEKGLFILTGSHQLELHQAITQSLAGRTALLRLLPMSLEELHQAGFSLTLDEALLMGGFPRIFQDKLEPTKAYRNYLETYLERDLRQLIHVKDLMQFQRFITLCAGRIGQLINLESIANDIGVSSPTLKQWLSILEASFIVIRLQPYFENFGKRVTKTPKLFFTDVGLATYLLGIEKLSQLERDPLRGNLFENLVLLELIKSRYNSGLDPHLYFYRDVNGKEIDFIFQRGHNLVPIEVKSSKTFNKDFLKNFKFFQELVGKRCDQGFLIYGGDQEQKIGEVTLLNYNHSNLLLANDPI